MRMLGLSLIGTLSLVLAGALAGASAAQDHATSTGQPESILFVGNSFTFFNGGVEKQVAGLAAAEDPPREIVADSSALPGATLKKHHFISEPESAYGTLDEIRAADHDVVVLQGDIPESYEQTVNLFLEYARLFDQEIKDAGAETVFFMTWPYERLDWIDLDGIVEAHRQVETELDAKVAPVGVAMEKALIERPMLPMLGFDREHESPAGTYLAAATIYATLFDRSPEGLGFTAHSVSPDDAAFLQRIAWEAVKEWRAGSPAE